MLLNMTMMRSSCLSPHSALTGSLICLIPKYVDLFLPRKGNLDYSAAMISMA